MWTNSGAAVLWLFTTWTKNCLLAAYCHSPPPPASLSSLPLPPLPPSGRDTRPVSLICYYWGRVIPAADRRPGGEPGLQRRSEDLRFSRNQEAARRWKRKQKAPSGDLLGLNICSHIILSFAQGCTFPRRAAHKHTPSYRSRRHTLICPFCCVHV